jgi:hypothetical protein
METKSPVVSTSNGLASTSSPNATTSSTERSELAATSLRAKTVSKSNVLSSEMAAN